MLIHVPSKLLCGLDDDTLRIDNLYIPQDELYLFVGKIIALSVLNGGPGPTFFAHAVVESTTFLREYLVSSLKSKTSQTRTFNKKYTQYVF